MHWDHSPVTSKPTWCCSQPSADTDISHTHKSRKKENVVSSSPFFLIYNHTEEPKENLNILREKSFCSGIARVLRKTATEDRRTTKKKRVFLEPFLRLVLTFCPHMNQRSVRRSDSRFIIRRKRLQQFFTLGKLSAVLQHCQ